MSPIKNSASPTRQNGRRTLGRIGLLLAGAGLLLGGESVARGGDYPLQVVPGKYPAPSSVNFKLSTLGFGSSSDTSALGGTGLLTVDSPTAPFGNARLTKVDLELLDGFQLSLLGGLIRVDAAPGAVQIRLVEPGPASPVIDGRFDQKGNLFQFAGEVLIANQPAPLDLATIEPREADLTDIRLSRQGNQLLVEGALDLEFTISLESALGPVPLQVNVQQTLRAVATVPTAGDLNGDGQVNATDIDLLAAGLRAGRTEDSWDLQPDGRVDLGDHRYLVENILRTYLGDSNLDGEFNTGDLVQVFQQGQYEDTTPDNSTWSSGDWDGDGDFNTSDFLMAFQGGGFEAGVRSALAADKPAVVPEPASTCLLAIGLGSLAAFRERRAQRDRNAS